MKARGLALIFQRYTTIYANFIKDKNLDQNSAVDS